MQAADGGTGFFARLIGDGRSLLSLVALCLILSGGFVIFQSATGRFLPQDEAFLRMGVKELCGYRQAHIVYFMFHDRVSFGGSLIALGFLYLWLVEFPMRERESWAWWTFLARGVTGFGSFLAYLGYGYLDTWHGAATLLLLVPYTWGMARTWPKMGFNGGPQMLVRPREKFVWDRNSVGRGLLLATGGGMMLGGAIILIVGMTRVFVPQDTAFIGLDAAQLNAINPRLVPLIAHDRAGFGGGIVTTGLVWFGCVWCGKFSRSLWQAIAIAGTVGFGCAIGIHPLIGYMSFFHLLPAYIGAALFLMGSFFSFRRVVLASNEDAS